MAPRARPPRRGLDAAWPDAAADRDRPARQRLDHLVDLLGRWGADRPDAARDTLTRVGAQVREDPTLLPMAMRLLANAARLAGADPEPVTTDLQGLAAATADLPALAAHTAELLRQRLERPGALWQPEVLLRAAERLHGEGGVSTGPLAVSLISAVGKRTGWS